MNRAKNSLSCALHFGEEKDGSGEKMHACKQTDTLKGKIILQTGAMKELSGGEGLGAIL